VRQIITFWERDERNVRGGDESLDVSLLSAPPEGRTRRSRSTEKDEDAKSSSSNVLSSKASTKKTPAQVKADSAAKRQNKV
jgi:hypothetical protein